jgi:hypothetical protein
MRQLAGWIASAGRVLFWIAICQVALFLIAAIGLIDRAGTGSFFAVAAGGFYVLAGFVASVMTLAASELLLAVADIADNSWSKTVGGG